MNYSIIGGIIIALGLYAVVSGKAKDYSESSSSSQKLPTMNAAPNNNTTDDLKIDITDKEQVQLDLASSKLPPDQQTDPKL